MAKVDLKNAKTRFMVLKAITAGAEEKIDLTPDKNGLYDISIMLNGWK